MKKKILSIALVVAMVAVIAAGSLAYFNDKDSATNTFTSGKVEITLNETDNAGNAFKQDQKLLPGSSSANAIAKNATVTVNEGSEDSWVWVEMLIPSKLYNSKTEANETNNALHYNQFINYLQGYDKDSTNANAQACANRYASDHQWSLMKYVGEVTIGNQSYSLLRTTHKDIVKAGETTSPAVNQFYMDNDVYVGENGQYMIPANGTAADPAKEFVAYNGSWEVIVNAYAIQAAGIADVDAAVAAFAAQGK